MSENDLQFLHKMREAIKGLKERRRELLSQRGDLDREINEIDKAFAQLGGPIQGGSKVRVSLKHPYRSGGGAVGGHPGAKHRGEDFNHELLQILSGAPPTGMTALQIRAALRPMRHEWIAPSTINNALRRLEDRHLVEIISRNPEGRPSASNPAPGAIFWKRSAKGQPDKGTVLIAGAQK